MQTNSRPAPLFTAYRWGTRCALAAMVGFSPLVRAQNSPAPAAETSATNSDGTELLSEDALDELLGPIALYPDALIALILPASTVPGDVTLAARYLANGGDANAVDDQSWDPSVKSLTRYPDVIKWMDDNLEWTTSVGQAFVAQPADVMNSIQQLRGEATAAGNLQDTPQQKVVKEVVEEKTYIRIVPAEPEVIYVPQYDPEVVYVERQPDYVGPIIGFGVGFAVGSWLNYDCDWGRRDVYCGDYNNDWYRGRNWDRGNNNNWVNNNTVNNVNNVNVVNIDNNTARPWRPSANSRRQLEQRRPAYNRRVQQANAEVRNARLQSGKTGAAARPKHVKSIPQPTRLASNPNRGNNGNGNNGNNPKNDRKNGNGNGKGNGNNAALKPSNPGPNANGNLGGKGNGNNKGKGDGNGNKNHGPKSPSAAPQVPGQLNKPKNQGNNDKKPGKGNNGNNQPNNSGNKPNSVNKPKNNPGNSGSAPKRQQQDRPKNSDGPSKKPSSSNQSVKRPSAAPSEVSRPKPKNNNNNNNDRPKAQNRPQSFTPQQPKAKANNDRPKQQSQPRPQGNPQANRPKPSNNKPSGGGGGGNGGGTKNKDKKKGDKKDN